MACCVVGAMLTAAVVGAARFVKHRVMRRPREADAAAWRLHPRDRAGVRTT